MEFPTDYHETYIVIPHKFSLNRIYEEDGLSHMTAATATLKISCAPIDDGDTSAEEMGTKAMVGFQRLKTWLEVILNNIVLIDADSDLLESLEENLSNQIMYVPGQPNDSMLAVLLHSKISAITKDLLEVYSVSLSATDTENIERCYRTKDGFYPLPGIEYYSGDPHHDIPWWGRPTIDTFEYSKDDDRKDRIWPKDTDPLQDIGKEFLTNNKEADIIVFDTWKKREE